MNVFDCAACRSPLVGHLSICPKCRTAVPNLESIAHAIKCWVEDRTVHGAYIALGVPTDLQVVEYLAAPSSPHEPTSSHVPLPTSEQALGQLLDTPRLRLPHQQRWLYVNLRDCARPFAGWFVNNRVGSVEIRSHYLPMAVEVFAAPAQTKPETYAMNLNEQLSKMLQGRDFNGLSNCMLAVLVDRPHQEEKPDADAKLLEQRLGEIVSAKYAIPKELTYPEPYRDKHISATDRGRWDRDTYVQLIIMAYSLGATRESLPSPLDQLVQYFKETAKQQDEAIRKAATEYSATGSHPSNGTFEDSFGRLTAQRNQRRAFIINDKNLDDETREQLLEALERRYREELRKLCKDDTWT